MPLPIVGESLTVAVFQSMKVLKNGRPSGRQQWNSVLKTGCSNAVRAAAVGTFERRVERAGLDDVFTGGTAASTLGL